MMPVFLVKSIKLVAPVDPVTPVDLVDLKNWFSIFKPKFLVRLDLTRECILALGGSFCYVSLMAFSMNIEVFLFLAN